MDLDEIPAKSNDSPPGPVEGPPDPGESPPDDVAGPDNRGDDERRSCTVEGPSDRGEPGALDDTFGNHGRVEALIEIFDVDEQEDGKLVFTGWSGEALTVCRLDRDGRPDTTFGSDAGCAKLEFGRDAAGSRVHLADEHIYVTGIAAGAFVARFTSSGEVDTAFGAGGWVPVRTDAFFAPNELLVLEDGLLVAGDVRGRAALTLLKSDGTADVTFGEGGTVVFGEGVEGTWPYYLAFDVLRHQGRFVATTGVSLHAFTVHGEPDTSFGDGDGVVELPFWAATLTSGPSSLFVAGRFMRVIRLSGTGVIDRIDEPLGSHMAKDVRVLDDETIVLAGIVSNGTSDVSPGIGRRSGATGLPDLEFGSNGAAYYWLSGDARELEVLCDGRYLLAGTQDSSRGVIIRVWNE